MTSYLMLVFSFGGMTVSFAAVLGLLRSKQRALSVPVQVIDGNPAVYGHKFIIFTPCVKRDVKPYSLTHPLCFTCICAMYVYSCIHIYVCCVCVCSGYCPSLHPSV